MQSPKCTNLCDGLSKKLNFKAQAPLRHGEEDNRVWPGLVYQLHVSWFDRMLQSLETNSDTAMSIFSSNESKTYHVQSCSCVPMCNFLPLSDLDFIFHSGVTKPNQFFSCQLWVIVFVVLDLIDIAFFGVINS